MTIKMTRLSCQAAAVIVFLSLSGIAWSQPQLPVAKQVMILWGNPDIGPWEQDFNQIVLRTLTSEYGIPTIPEFLSLIQASDETKRLNSEALRLMFPDTQFDLIIAVQAEANTFAMEWSEQFAPGAPVLHVLPGIDVLESVGNTEERFIINSQVEEATRSTIALIDDLFPSLETLYVIGGDGEGDRSYLQRIESVVDSMALSSKAIYLRGLTPAELVEEFDNVAGTNAIFLSTYDRDRTGNPLRAMGINSMLDAYVNIPVFGVFDTLLESGAIGGDMTSSSHYANATLEAALQILSDSVPADFDTVPAHSFMFDYPTLQRYGIDVEDLPDSSRILNHEQTVWEQYRMQIVVVLVLIVAQAVLIFVLISAIRRRKAAEIALQRASKMEVLGALAGGIAHDFNNVLMSIMGNTELIRLREEVSERTLDKLQKISAAANRAKNLIAEILLFSRQAATADLELVDPCSLLSETVEQLRAHLPETCEIVLQCPADICNIEANATQINQVITNLCVNAQHAMKGVGIIEVIVSESRIEQKTLTSGSTLPAGNYLTISVNDKGCGISEEYLLHIFEPFYTTKATGEGTGLGLAMAYQIIKIHKGYIDVQSRIGEGTSFTIYLSPASGRRESGIAESHPELVRGNQERILLVDDDFLVLDSLGKTLEVLGYQVEQYSDPIHALEIFKQKPKDFDLLITDLSMPQMDGVRLATRIRDIQGDIPIVISSGYVKSVSDIDLENVRVVLKPVSLHELSNILADIFR